MARAMESREIYGVFMEEKERCGERRRAKAPASFLESNATLRIFFAFDSYQDAVSGLILVTTDNRSLQPAEVNLYRTAQLARSEVFLRGIQQHSDIMQRQGAVMLRSGYGTSARRRCAQRQPCLACAYVSPGFA
jgi:hypothetical protein